MSPVLFHAKGLPADVWLPALRAALAPRTVLTLADLPDEAALAQVEELVTWKGVGEVIERLPNLRVLVNLGAGIDHLTGLPLGEAVAVHRLEDAGMGAQMAEFALHWAIHFQRDFDRYLPMTRAGDWRELPYRPPGDVPCGVLGLGTLGAQVAQRLRDGGFPVSGWSRSPKSLEGVTAFAGEESLAPFLGGAEVLINLLPGTPETRGILDGARLDLLPPGAVVINLGRGMTTPLDDLLPRLDGTRLRAAVLDVADPEPPPADHPVRHHPRVYLTPHISAQTQPGLAAELVARVLTARDRGEAGPGLVRDLARGY